MNDKIVEEFVNIYKAGSSDEAWDEFSCLSSDEKKKLLTKLLELAISPKNNNKAVVMPNVASVIKRKLKPDVKFNEWYEAGHHIVLTTARPWHLELITKQQMERAGIRYHQIVMGIGREERILINNNSSKEPQRDRAFGVPVLRDSGFDNLEWSSVGL